MITGEYPFKGIDMDDFVDRMYDKDFLNIKCVGPFRELMNMTLRVDPNERFSAESILKTNVFRSAEVITDYKRKGKPTLMESQSVKITRQKQSFLVIPKPVRVNSHKLF